MKTFILLCDKNIQDNMYQILSGSAQFCIFRFTTAVFVTNTIHKITMTSFAITLYSHCCRLHVVGQPIVSDIGVVHT